MAGSVSVNSDYRFRGYSLSYGKPVASAELSYDDRSGLYVNGAVTGVARSGSVDLLGYQANVGFARRISSTVSVDAGVTHSLYRYRIYDINRSASYDEAYLGLNAHNISARLSYSPHYFRPDVTTLYGEVEAGFQPAAKWRLSGHVGALKYLTTPYDFDDRTRFDWRVSASRELGQLEIHSALSGGSPRNRYTYDIGQTGVALTVGASLNF
jgi:uncharacterized protein (TIGR02001 family)